MKAILTAVLACGSLAVAASSWPAEQSGADPIRIAGQTGGRFVLTQGQHRTVLDLQSGISGCTTQTYDPVSNVRGDVRYGVRVLDEVSRGNFWYVVMQVDTPPNCNVNGLCGAAINTDVLWLKLDRNLNLLSRQAESVQNCQSNRNVLLDPPDSTEPVPLNMRGGVLTVRMEETRFGGDGTSQAARRTVLRYDRQTPERGLTVR